MVSKNQAGVIMGKLFIIGNGFDLEHDLKTEYKDFYNYLMEDYQRSTFINNIEKIVACSSDELWSSFEKNLGNLNLDIFMEEVMSERKDFNNDFDYGLLDESHLINFTIENRISSLHKLDGMVKDWIETISFKNVTPKKKYQNIFTETSFFINFNYTNTLQEVYGIADEKVFHVHGDVTDPIMGHGMDGEANYYQKFETIDFATNEFNTAIYEQIEQFYNNSRKETYVFSRQMINFIQRMNIEIDEVCIIGHSLGEVDSIYFRELSNYYYDKPWIIYSRYSDEYEVNKDKESKLKLLHQINNQLHADVKSFK